MFKDIFSGKNKKNKLKLSEAAKFQSQINREIYNHYRLFELSPQTSLQPSKLDMEKHAFKEKENMCAGYNSLINSKDTDLQDLILLRQLVVESTPQNQEKVVLQKKLQKNKEDAYNRSSPLKKNFSLPKLRLNSKEPRKNQRLFRTQKKENVAKTIQDTLLIKLIEKMRQHILLRKEGEFIYMSLKQLIKFLNFLITLIKCQKQDKVSKIFQKYPNYNFFKDTALQLFRFYDKPQNESIDTRRSLGAKFSLLKQKSKSNVILRKKKQKNEKLKPNEIDMNKTSISLKLKQPEILNNESQKQRYQTKIQKQNRLPQLELDKYFDEIEAMLKEYLLFKNYEPKQNNKKIFCTKRLEQHIIQEMQIFNNKVLYDPLLVPDVKKKLMRNIICRAFQRRFSKDHHPQTQFHKYDQKSQLSQKTNQLMNPFFRLKQVIKEQLLQKNNQKINKKDMIQKKKAIKQILYKIANLVEELKRNTNLSEKQCEKLKQIEELCNNTSTKCITFQISEG